jgi:hypothetical protein
MTLSDRRRQLATLLRKDLRLFTQRAQYRLYAALLLITVAYGVISGIQRYNSAVHSYDHWSDLQQKTILELRFAPSLIGPGYTQRVRPEVMSIFAMGADDLITAPYTTRGWTKQQTAYFNPDGAVARLIPTLDIMAIVLLLGSLFAMYLCHDFAVDEIWNRTAVTTALFNVSARMCVMSKYISMVIGVALPSGLLLMVATVVVAVATRTFSAEYFVRCLVFLGVVFAYQCIWVALALLVQTVARTQRNALVYGVGVWVFVIFVVPNLLTIIDPDRGAETTTPFVEAKAAALREHALVYNAYRPGEVPPTQGFSEYIRFHHSVEAKLHREGTYARVLQETAKAPRRRLDDFVRSALSPYTSAAVAGTEIANTGLGTVLEARADMLRYHEYYIAKMDSAPLLEWQYHPDRGVPVASIRQLDAEHARPGLKQNLMTAKIPFLALLFELLVLVPLAIFMMGRRFDGGEQQR